MMPYGGSASSSKKRIAVLPVKHKAVLDTCEALSKKGLAEIVFLHVDRLQTLLQESIPDLVINGDRTNRLAGFDP
jgi:hypothetical protein